MGFGAYTGIPKIYGFNEVTESEDNKMTKYIFPVALIVLDFGAAIVYAAQKDIRMATYWFAAAVLNITVTSGG